MFFPLSETAAQANAAGEIGPDQISAVQNVMRETGCAYEEAVAAVKGGKVHPAQASSVMAMVSQSGLAYLRGGLWIVLCSGAS